MPEPSPEAVEALFQQAADLNAAERGSFLDKRCASDPDLRAAVEELLQFDAEALSEPDFLPSPAVEVRATLPLFAQLKFPKFIGRYRILRRHGEGGMGTVYEAEQDNPRRAVALKVIRGDLVSAEFLNRFRHEAQVLGRLQHPGIAQVYEAGTGEDGQPFFAMEFIRGTPLDDYARVHGLGAPARLELSAKVCDAVQHAHDKGVIHRDLKPANILVDESGQPKVLDFGVARITDADLRSTSSQTQTGQLVGTLSYMSPEQLTARPSGLDGRSDVYTLGVILFELLALRLPYDLEQLPAHEMARVIEHQEASRLGSIARPYRGDLEIIVAKALEKEKTRRYASAGDLASDIRRYLRGEAILARPASALYQLRKFARRNRALVAGVSGVFAALLVGTVVSILFALRADENARAAERARLEANRARDTAEAARGAAQAEAYRAVLSEVKALRAGHQLGWREEALAGLSRLVSMPTPRRDVVELRSEAVATIGEFGVNEVARLQAPELTQYGLDFSPDSQTLVTASGNNDLNLWDVPGRKLLRRLAGVTGRVRGIPGGQVRFLPDGELAVINASRRIAFLTALGRPSARPLIERGMTNAVKLSIDRQGRWLAVGWDDGRIDLFDAGTGRLQRSFSWKPGNFSFSPDGQWLALERPNDSIQLLRADGQGDPFTLGDRRSLAPEFASSAGGVTLASVMGRSLVIWDLDLKEELLRLGGHKESITGVAFSPDGALVATTCGDHMTRIWDARDGRALAVIPGPWFMRSLAFSPDGRYLAASADPGPVCLYEFNGWREQRRLVGHTYSAQCVTFHPRLPRLASGSDDCSIVVWDAEKASGVRRWQAYKIWVTGLTYSPDGSLLASACGNSSAYSFENDHSIHLWNADLGMLKKRLPRPPPMGVHALAFDPTGRRVLAGDDGGTVYLWDVESAKTVRRENLDASPIRSAVFANGGRQVVVGHFGGTVALIDLEGKGLLRRILIPEGCARLTVDDHSQRVIVGDRNGGLSTLTLPDLTVVHKLAHAHADDIFALILSSDGRLLATSGRDRRVVLREARTFEPWFTFPTWTNLVKDLAFDASGRWLALAGADSEIALWDLTLLHEGLEAVGLAWGEPRPAVAARAGSARSHVSTAFPAPSTSLVVGGRPQPSSVPWPIAGPRR
jgi:WD40 repeat protein/predicted Ser/Thr protein kinase